MHKGAFSWYTLFSFFLISCASALCGARSQTDAYLSVPGMQADIEWRFGSLMKKHATLIDKVLKKEREMSVDYYVFYHGQPGELRILQDFITEIYLQENNLAPYALADFVPLRFHKEPLPCAAYDMPAFCDWIKKDFTCIDDNVQQDLRIALLSVNLSFFGNRLRLTSNSFHYFCNSLGHNYFDVKHELISIIKHVGLPEKYIDDLLALNTSIAQKAGNLLQICVPKNKADELMYLALPGGAPYATALVAADFDKHKKCHTRISSVLEKYIIEPQSIAAVIDQLQARIIVSRHQLGISPDSGVKIFRYTTVSDDAMSAYKSALHELVQTMYAEKDVAEVVL